MISKGLSKNLMAKYKDSNKPYASEELLLEQKSW